MKREEKAQLSLRVSAKWQKAKRPKSEKIILRAFLLTKQTKVAFKETLRNRKKEP